jgi:hypothetical protein
MLKKPLKTRKNGNYITLNYNYTTFKLANFNKCRIALSKCSLVYAADNCL